MICICTLSICSSDSSVLGASPQVDEAASPSENASSAVEAQQDADSVPADEANQDTQASEEQQFIEAILESTPAPSEIVAPEAGEEVCGSH